MWWRVPVIPATQEAEAGELPEPRRRRLWWAEITPLHSSLGNKSKTPSQKKKKSQIYIILKWGTYSLFFKLHFRFCGTCADHAGLLHRYIHGKVVCCLHHPVSYIWHFSPCYLSPTSPPLIVPPLAPYSRLQCVMLPYLCPCVLIVQHPPMSENMRRLIFCCVSLLRMMVSRFIHVPTKGMNSSMFMAA